jgi:hypothetical protein
VTAASKRAATAAERGRASRIRARLSLGARVSARDRTWLDRYKLAREAFRAEHQWRSWLAKWSRKRSTANDARRWAVEIAAMLDLPIKRPRSLLVRLPGAHRGEIDYPEDGDTYVYPHILMEEIDPRSEAVEIAKTKTFDRLANVRVRFTKPTNITDHIWVSLSAMTPNWRNIPADSIIRLSELMGEKYMREYLTDDEDMDAGWLITAISVQVNHPINPEK